MILEGEQNKLSGLTLDWVNLGKIEEGVFGKVYKVCNKVTNQTYAIKQMKTHKSDDGVPYDTLREIVILRNLEHENILKLHDVIYTDEKMYLIFEFMDSDLNKFIQSFGTEPMPLRIIKEILRQILNGLCYLNFRDTLHRDLAPKNILVNFPSKEKIIVKLADFGLARTQSVLTQNLTKEVVTPLYRAPELFLGSTNDYSSQIDIWSLGCIFAEMFTKTPLFLANTERDVFLKIIKMFGIENYSKLKFNYDELNCNIKYLTDIIPSLDPIGLDLMQKMLNLDPNKRITAWEALNHEFLQS